MKKLLLLSLASLLIFAGCSEKDKDMDPDYTPITVGNVPSGGLVLPSSVGSTTTFTVTSSEIWTISKNSSDTWFSVTPTTGSPGTTTVTVVINEENPYDDDRTANITIGGTTTVTITQKRANALILSPYKQEVSGEGEVLEITLMHNINYTLIISEGWIKKVNSKSLSTETLYFQIDPLDEDDIWDGRYGEIIIKDQDSDLADTVKIYQTPKDWLIIYPATDKTAYVDYAGRQVDVVLRSNINYIAEIVDADQTDWVHFLMEADLKSGYRDDTYSFIVDSWDGVDENRTAKVVFKDSGSKVSDTLYIVQSYKDAVVLSQDKYEIDYHSFEFKVVLSVNTNNITYDVEYDQNGSGWITTEELMPELKSSLYDKVITFSAYQNFAPVAREAKIHFIVPTTGESQTVTIIQGRGADLDSKIFGERAMYVQRVYTNPNSSTWAVTNEVLVSWRSLPGEDTEFDVYRITGGEEVKLNTEPVSSSTNYMDTPPDFTGDITYILKVAGTNVELDRYVLTVARATEPWITIPMLMDLPSYPNPYNASELLEYKLKDICIGDLTGNGQYDIVVRRECHSVDLAESKACAGEAILEGYTLDGQFLWRVKLGPNIVQGEHTVPFIVYDLDGDGRAEVVVRTSELTTFGDGWQQSGEVYASDSNPRAIGAPEYLSVIDGTTGMLKAQVDYIDPGPQSEWADTWGDTYGNRVHRHNMAVGYFDGSNPSIFISRGYYVGQTIMQAWDYRGGQLTQRWEFKAAKNGPNAAFDGQGNHQIRIADVDGDGRDDVIFGAMTVSSYGTGLYSYGYGHGDAIQVGKFIKGSTGLQIWSCFEDGDVGASFRDPLGHEYFKFMSTDDVGRSVICNFNPNHNGYLMWTSSNSGQYWDTEGNSMGYLSDLTSEWDRHLGMTIWWSGSLNRQLTWRTIITGHDGNGFTRLHTLWPMGSTTHSNKDCPLFYGDIFGDWREEIMFATSDHNAVIIYSTPFETEYRIPYLMSDHVYKLSAIHQNVGYNQPTNTGFYMGPDMFD
ncbi:MAG: hypothetical protein LIO79_11085 [Rikenellaceae bacterium]|nr:hypothetical protein [Rikenellaceae bacterium]